MTETEWRRRRLTSELRRDPLSGRTVVIAPRRAERPGAPRPSVEPVTEEELETCPFCAGREHMTPPETLRLPGQGAAGWKVRVVPNLYPAFERQEVVIHSPRHVRSFADLEDAEVELVAEAWRRRREVEPGGYLLALINEGRAAGASLHHSHSQLVWLAEPPASTTGEAGLDRASIVLERGGVVLACPYASRVPYELVLVPVGELELRPLLAALGEGLRRLRTVEGPVPVNAWLHTGAAPRLEVVPRLTVLAGLELAAGVYVNPLAPEEAARRLREAATGSRVRA